MTITKYFVGGELEAFVQGSDASTTWITSAGTYDSNFSRGSVSLAKAFNSSYINIPLTSAQPTFWFSMQSYRNSSGSTVTNGTWLQFVNASLTPVYRIVGVGGASNTQPLVQWQSWSGSAWVNIGSPMVVPTDTRHKWDFQFNIADTLGVARCYVDGVLMGELTGDTSFISPSTIAACQVYVTGSNTGSGITNQVTVSEVQALDVSTLGRRMATLVISAPGTTDAWTPSTGVNSTDTLDDIGSYADTDYASSPTANQIYTGVTSDLSATAQQYAVDSVVIAYRPLRGATGPQNLKGVVRVGGTNYASTSNVATLNTVFGYTWADFDLNPATSAAWTPTEINTAGFETGAKSIA